MSSENEVEVEEERSLHHLLRRHKANVEDVQALISKYPDEVKKKEGRHNSLPLHTALMGRASVEVVMLLINEYPQAAKTRVEGLLPLGVVLTKRSSDDMVLAVLEAYPEAARKRFSTKFDECILPLHMACEDKHSEPVKDALRHAYPDAEKENPFETIYLLHKFLENEPLDQGGDDVENLIEKYPEAVGKRGRDGRLPLHIAIDRIAPVYVTITLFEAYRQAGKEKMEDGRLPIEVFAEQKVTDDWPQEYLTQMAKLLLGNDMPVSIEDGTPKEHSGSWHICISSSTETATSAVRGVLLEFENISDYDSDDLCGFGKHIHALADVCDDQGRTALNLAAKGPRAVINEYLLFCGRYKLKSGPPEHRTATSVILRAQDVGEQTDYSVIFDKADKDKNGNLNRKQLIAIAASIGLDPGMFLKGSEKSDESISKEEFVSICKLQLGDGPREVVIKLMQKKDQWERECNARTKNTLHPKYVVSALSNVPSDTEIAYAVRHGEGGLDIIREKYLNNIEPGIYAIVMPSADRNLHEIFHQEQPNIDAVRDMLDAVREILRQVFEAVKHLHEKNLMHGDIKMPNIVRFRIDNGLRLIDLDASARIVPPGGADETFAGVKFSSAVLPPEMIKRIDTEEQLDEFNEYWKAAGSDDVLEKVTPKLYLEQGIEKARYVVKSFRTGLDGKPVKEGLPYELVHASESIDLWSLGVLAFTLLTGEPLIPSTRDDDCVSGAAMHFLHSWGTQPEVLIELSRKIEDNAACDLVWKLLQKEPGKRKKVADLLKSHPFFNQQSADVLERRSAIFENLLFYGQYKFFDGPPEHRTATSVILRAQDYGDQSDYGVTFDKADKDKNGNLDLQELEKIASSIGLNPELFLRGSDTTSKLIFVDVCKRQLGDGPREVVIKLMKNKDQWERECNFRKKYDLDPKFVVTAQPKIPPEDDSANAKEKGDGGLNIIVEKFLDGIEVGQHALVMPAADRNLFQMFHQDQPKIDAVREILRQVFEAVKHLHEKNLMHGDIKMANIVRFRIDNGLRLMDLDTSFVEIVPPGGDEESFAGAKFSSAILPPEMIERIEKDQVPGFLKYWEGEHGEDLVTRMTPKIYMDQGIVKSQYVVKSFRTRVDGKPVKEGLPYELVHASESIDLWSLGVLAFTLMTGETLVPSNRDNDCASGAAMHSLHSWGTQPEVLTELFNKITDDAAFDLVWKLLQKEPGKRKKVADLLKSHPFFNQQSADVLERRSSIFENLLFYGRYKLIYGPPEHRSQTSVVFRAHDLDQQADYGVTFDKADKNEDGNLDLKELKRIASSIGLDPALLLKGSDAISKEEFVGICKRQLGDGPREVVIKLMQKKNQWERECTARKENSLNEKYVVTAQPVIPPEDDIPNAKGRGDGGLNVIVEKFLKDIKLGNYVIVMPAADRNLHEIFHQEQPNIDAVRDMLTQVFEAVKHLHEEKLMHGDIKMGNIMRFRIDNRLCLIDLDASARIVPRGGDDETFAGAKFSSAILPPEMIEKIETEEQLEEFNKYWESEDDEDLKKKVAPKLYKRARYVVKSFRTDEEGKPIVDKRLPYEELVRASENIDVWSLGVLAFTLLTGEALIPSNREDDCLSGAAMHLLKSWGTRSDVLIDRFKKIQNDAARDLVMKLLQRDPAKRPTVASLLDKHLFFHSEMSAGTEDQFREMKEYLQNITNQVGILNATMLEVKKLSIESKKELFNTRHDLHRTRHVLLNGIFEATDVRTPTAFIILNKELPPAAEPTDEKVEKILDIVTAEDGSGVSMNTKYVSVTLTAEGADMALEGDLKEHHDRFQDGLKWAKRMKDIGTNFATGDIDEAFKTIREGIDDLIVGNTIYLYLIDELTGKPVEAKGWPLIITTPSEKVPRLIPLMQVGMVAISICNGAAGLAKMFSIPAPIVPKAWSKGAQESIELLKQESSVQEFGIVHAQVKKGNEEAESVRGASLREFQDFLNKHDPGLKNGNSGHYAGLQRICDPEEGAALWTALTDKAAIESALKERATQREVEERKQNMHNRQEEMAESTLVTKEEISEVVDLSTVSSGGRNIDESRDTSKCVVTEKKRKLSGAKNAAAEERCAADEENISAPSAAVGSEETELAKGSKKATAASKGVSSTSASGNVYQMNFCNDCCTIM